MAGKQIGMTEGSESRSSLLWHVARLLRETKEKPQLLIMENVTAVHSKKFINDWNRWLSTLEDLGYKNFYSDMQAKEFGIPQSRNRTFMVSIYDSKAKYVFPETIPLKTCMKDYLEKEVDEKYYLNSPKAKALIEKLLESGRLKDLPIDKPLGNVPPLDNDKIHQRNWIYNENGIAPCITSTCYKDAPRVAVELERLGNIYGEDKGYSFAGNCWNQNGLSPAILTAQGGQRQPLIVEKNIVGSIGSLQEHATINDGEIIPCIPSASGMGGGHTPMVVEKESVCVTSRGRNIENPSDRRPGIELEQRLEVREEGICECLTSVFKDNMILEKTKEKSDGQG